jgi:hypothetical protein
MIGASFFSSFFGHSGFQPISPSAHAATAGMEDYYERFAAAAPCAYGRIPL